MSNNEQPNSEHLDDEHWHDTSNPTLLIDGLGGTTEYVQPDLTKEALLMLAERYGMDETAKQLLLVLAPSTTRVQRVVQASGELVCRTMSLIANQPSKIVNENYQRSRLIITGNNINVAMGKDASVSLQSASQAGFSSTMIGYAGSAFTREIRSYRDIWLVCDTAASVGIQEEFVA